MIALRLGLSKVSVASQSSNHRKLATTNRLDARRRHPPLNSRLVLRR